MIQVINNRPATKNNKKLDFRFIESVFFISDPFYNPASLNKSLLGLFSPMNRTPDLNRCIKVSVLILMEHPQRI